MRYSIINGMILAGLATAIPTTDRRSLNPIASADFFACNDFPTDVTCSTSDNYWMGTALQDSFVVPHGKCAQAQRIKATWVPLIQSQFNFKFGGQQPSSYNFKLGHLTEKTAVTAGPGNPAFLGEALIAPNNPLGGAPDYNIYVLGGQNMLAPIINGLISSKIPAIAAGLKTKPAAIALPIKGISLSLNGIPSNIKATYAGVRSMAATWNANLVLAISGDFTGTMYFDALKTSVPFTITLTNFKAYANLDLNVATLSAKINSLATSLDGLNVSSELLACFTKIGADILKFIHAADDICGIVNTDYNAKVLEMANGAIAGGLGGLGKRDVEAFFADIAKRGLTK